MAGFGDPFALELGGGPSAADKVYGDLRSAVGEGNRGAEDASIVEAWRMAVARGVAAAVCDERAALQVSPLTATEALPRFEERLRHRLPADATEQDRRDALLPLHVRRVDPTGPSLLARVRAINPGASLISQSRTTQTETQLGRAVEDHDPGHAMAAGPAFNLVAGLAGSKVTAVPNYSGAHLLIVQSPLLGSVFQQQDAKSLQRIWKLLDEEVPAWVDLRVFASCGFYLDRDPLDATAFC